MEVKPDSLAGLDSAAARDYIFGFISTLKITEKEIETIRENELLWDRRAVLAAGQNRPDLQQEAENEKQRLMSKRILLENEAAELKTTIEKLKTELRILPARERSIDPDLLEQELLILAGRMPGEEKEAARDRAFEKLEKEAMADAELEALKSRMGK